MRIIAGKSKGRPIQTPKGRGTRPALAKVREAIFSSLGDISNKVVMDIFAGSGSLGLEALSRDAAFVYFIEDGPQALRCILQNLDYLGFSHQAKAFKRSMPRGLEKLKIDHKIDILFCDPPYDKNLVTPTLTALCEHGIILENTIVIVEHTRREMPQCKLLEVVKERKYGQTLISYLRCRKST